MLELEIKGKAYSFKFGFGFLKKINAEYKSMAEMGVMLPVGFKYVVSLLIDGQFDALVKILMAANATEKPRLSEHDLEDYLDDEGTDVIALRDEVLDFLSKSNACKDLMSQINKALQEAKKN